MYSLKVSLKAVLDLSDAKIVKKIGISQAKLAAPWRIILPTKASIYGGANGSLCRGAGLIGVGAFARRAEGHDRIVIGGSGGRAGIGVARGDHVAGDRDVRSSAGGGAEHFIAGGADSRRPGKGYLLASRCGNQRGRRILQAGWAVGDQAGDLRRGERRIIDPEFVDYAVEIGVRRILRMADVVKVGTAQAGGIERHGSVLPDLRSVDIKRADGTSQRDSDMMPPANGEVARAGDPLFVAAAAGGDGETDAGTGIRGEEHVDVGAGAKIEEARPSWRGTKIRPHGDGAVG